MGQVVAAAASASRAATSRHEGLRNRPRAESLRAGRTLDLSRSDGEATHAGVKDTRRSRTLEYRRHLRTLPEPRNATHARRVLPAASSSADLMPYLDGDPDLIMIDEPTEALRLKSSNRSGSSAESGSAHFDPADRTEAGDCARYLRTALSHGHVASSSKARRRPKNNEAIRKEWLEV